MEVNLSAIPKAAKFVLGVNWRTTVGGLSAMFSSLALVSSSIGRGEWPEMRDLAIIGVGLSTAWVGIFGKDKAVTGGTVSNIDGTTVAAPVSLIPPAAPSK